MNSIVTHIADTLLENEQFDEMEETYKTTMARESRGICHEANTFDLFLILTRRALDNYHKAKPQL